MYKLIFKEKHVLSNEKIFDASSCHFLFFYIKRKVTHECLMNTNTSKFYTHLSAIQIIFYIVWIVCMEFESSFCAVCM
jgi:hypothetical protein